MSSEIDEEKASDIVKSIKIPPQPQILTAIMEEEEQSSPDLRKIADLISQDVGLSAATLKTVNSPFFGLSRTIGSINQACMLLGFNNVKNIVTGLTLRASMGGDEGSNQFLSKFWDLSSDIALVCAGIAKETLIMPADEAYTLGLFHDCGVPLMMQRFDNYQSVYESAHEIEDQSIPDVEQEEFSTSHAAVGYLVCRTWKLPDALGRAIAHHHNTEVFTTAVEGVDDDVLNRVALLMAAEHVAHSFMHLPEHSEWLRHDEVVLNQLDLSDGDFSSIQDMIFDKLSER